MPRADGVSLTSTVCRIRRSPSPRTTASWLRLKPTGLLTSVTLNVPALFVSVRSLAMRCSEIRQLLATQPCDRDRIFERPETGECGADHVVRVRRSERLRQDVRDPCRFDDGAH